jgi:photosystem II stability/assembly factor-like uncharacterized protein
VLAKLTVLLAALAVGLTGCGRDDEPAVDQSGGSNESAEAGPEHVHGLGINPADGALFIATHTGLFRVAQGQERARRVGEGTQDTMGFTVVGRNRFLGSGHPGEGESGPPALGLIESTDAGRSWKTISLDGEADFHVLRFAAGRIYGFDAGNGRLMVSRNAGRDWKELSLPEPLLDLVADPADPDRLIASGQGGLHRSSDGGKTWQKLGGNIALLAWPASDRVYRVGGDARVSMSTDSGRTWREVGSIGQPPAALLAQSPRELYAALPDGTIVQSRNGAKSWSVRSRP